MDWRSYLVFLQMFSRCGPRRVSAVFWPSSVHILIVSSLRGCMTLTLFFFKKNFFSLDTLHCQPSTCCRTKKKDRGVVNSIKRKTRHGCIVEAHESARKRNRETQQGDHIEEKGFNLLSHYTLVRIHIPTHQAMKIQDAKAEAHKKWNNLENCHKKNACMASDESQAQERGHRKVTN